MKFDGGEGSERRVKVERLDDDRRAVVVSGPIERERRRKETREGGRRESFIF